MASVSLLHENERIRPGIPLIYIGGVAAARRSWASLRLAASVYLATSGVKPTSTDLPPRRGAIGLSAGPLSA